MDGEKDFNAELIAERQKSARETRDNMTKEIEQLKGILQKAEDKNATFDELIIPLHNLLLIVPRERFYFRERIIKLFDLLDSNIQKKHDVSYVIARLLLLKDDDKEPETQSTDYAMYWSAYRKALYTYGEFDNTKQEKVQGRMRNQMVKLCKEYIGRRERGIKLATTMIGE